MARALIVGCGCRGRELGRALRDQGWQVRGTSRWEERTGTIEATGIEAAVADPDRAGTVLEQIGDVTVLAYLMATAQAEPEVIAAIHGPRLERILEKLVDSPVRGFVYEASGTVQPAYLTAGARLVAEAGERWRIPTALIEADAGDHERWLAEALGAVTGVTARPLDAYNLSQ